MRAIHVNTSTAWGGLEQYTLYLAQVFREAGVRVTIMAVEGSQLYISAQAQGFAMIRASSGNHLNPTNIWRLRRALDRNTIVHSHTRIDVWVSSLACFGTNAPHVHSVHMVPSNKRDPLHAFIYGRVDAIVNTSETHVHSIVRLFPVERSAVHLIRHMRDPKTFTFNPTARASYRASWKVADNDIVVGYLARIDPLKGTKEFAQAAHLLPQSEYKNITFVVVGDPTISRNGTNGLPLYEHSSQSLHEELLSMANDEESQLIVCPFTTDVAGVMSAFDIFVLSSYGEMYALTVIEAMMIGLPVIGTNLDGTQDQLADGRGLLIDSRSSQAIDDAVNDLAHDPQNRTTLGKRGREWAVNECDPVHVAPQWLSLYSSVLQKRQSQ